MRRRTILDHILSLEPERDHQEIVYLVTFHEFPFDITRSLEFALFRTFAAPNIGGLLDRTGEFARGAQKRYDDTDLILSEMLEHGYDSERGRAAIRRLNQIHGRFQISNEDFLYVLSTFTFEPIRWVDRFGWRPMVEQEKLAQYYYWRQVGRRMNIKDIPESIDTFERYNIDYEREHFVYSEANQRIAIATRDLFLGWVLPRSLYGFGEPVIYAMLDDPLLEAFGFPKPPLRLRQFVHGLLRARAKLLRLLPERKRPKLRTGPRKPTYPKGYRIEDLGPSLEDAKHGND